MQIVHYPHPALSRKSKPVLKIDAKLKSVVAQMFELMYEARGIGLAANQVALPWRLFVVNPSGDRENKDDEMVFINPEVVSRTGSAEGEEGCLSLPELYGQVRRPEKIAVEAYDLDGQGFRLEVDQLLARVIQHENDHLDGVMFVDRMSDVARRELEPRLEDFVTAFRRQQESGAIESDDLLRKQLDDLEPEE